MRYDTADSGTMDTSHSEQPLFIPQGGDDSRLAEQAPLGPDSFSRQTQQLGSPHDMSWPWLYETLFLPNDTIFSWPQVNPPGASDERGISHDLPIQSHDESLGFLPQSWETHSTATGNLALGQSFDPAVNTPCLPSTSMDFSSGGGRDRDEGRRLLYAPVYCPMTDYYNRRLLHLAVRISPGKGSYKARPSSRNLCTRLLRIGRNSHVAPQVWT
jgi:hypothetical protein